MISRKIEKYHLKLLAGAHLENTTIYMDRKFKISLFIKDVRQINFETDLVIALDAVKALHHAKIHSKYDFDFANKLSLYESLTNDIDQTTLQSLINYEPYRKLILNDYCKFVMPHCNVLCHNDLFGPNILIAHQKAILID